MSRMAMTLTMLAILLLWESPSASAYVWKCHTPQGDIWTSQPGTSDDCEEFDDQYNPTAAPPPGMPAASLPASSQVIVPVPVPVPAPGPYVYAPYYYAPGYYGLGAVIIRPPFRYPYHFYGGHLHGGHFRR
jgi:hypothetical protein